MDLFLPLILVGLTAGGVHAQDSAGPPDGGASAASQTSVFTGNRTVAAGEVVEDITVLGGNLRVAGEVTGTAVVVGGDLILEESAIIRGDAVVTGGQLLNEGGRVGGEMRTIGGQGLDIDREIQRAAGAGAAGATVGAAAGPREEPVRVVRSSRQEPRQRFWSNSIRRGFAGIVSTLAFGLVLAGVGSALVFYGRPYLETVSDTIRSSTVRAGATGLAASFLAIPAFTVLLVALVVSIVGIPFLLVAIPLYPVALFAGAVFGLLGVLHAIGERTAEQSRDIDLRHRNSYAYLFTGLAMLLLPQLAAHLLSMTGFLGFIGTLVRVLTWIAIWAAATVGFGAVILSRAGTRRTFIRTPPDAGFNSDDFFGDEPLGSS